MSEATRLEQFTIRVLDEHGQLIHPSKVRPGARERLYAVEVYDDGGALRLSMTATEFDLDEAVAYAESFCDEIGGWEVETHPLPVERLTVSMTIDRPIAQPAAADGEKVRG